ncbi:MAG: hypothetical protein HQK61_00140 [Desulfamplus sp.]|nr:hypothetical protein [Desulfamplus sp.]
MRLKDIKNNLNIVNAVDWDMTPEEAIALHLEWGQLRGQAYYRDHNNETVYFAINTWKKPPIVTLIKRKGFDSEELSTFRMPKKIENKFIESHGKHKGVFAVDGEVREWLKKELDC